MTRLVCAVLAIALVWWLAHALPVWLVYKGEQRMLEDRMRQLEQVRQHEDEFSRKLREGKPWK